MCEDDHMCASDGIAHMCVYDGIACAREWLLLGSRDSISIIIACVQNTHTHTYTHIHHTQKNKQSHRLATATEPQAPHS